MKKLLFFLFLSVYLLTFSKGIISLAPNITKMLQDLSLGNSICGTVKEDSFPKGVKVGHFMNINYEKIISLKPEYVFCVGITQERIFKKLKEFKINAVQIRIFSVKDLKKNYIMLGNIFHLEERAKKINERIDTIIKGFRPLNKTYMGIIWYSPMVGFGKNTFQADLLKQLGLNNSLGYVKKWYRMISKESIVKNNPQLFFIVMKKGDKIKNKIMKSKTLKNLSFVKNKKIIVIDDYDNFFQPSLRSLFLIEKLYEKMKKEL